MKIGRVSPVSVNLNTDVVPVGIEGVVDFNQKLDAERPTLSKSETRQLLRDATFGFEGR